MSTDLQLNCIFQKATLAKKKAKFYQCVRASADDVNVNLCMYVCVPIDCNILNFYCLLYWGCSVAAAADGPCLGLMRPLPMQYFFFLIAFHKVAVAVSYGSVCVCVWKVAYVWVWKVACVRCSCAARFEKLTHYFVDWLLTIANSNSAPSLHPITLLG